MTIIIIIITDGLHRKGFNSDAFKSGRLHKKHAVATFTFGNLLSICLTAVAGLWMHTDF